MRRRPSHPVAGDEFRGSRSAITVPHPVRTDGQVFVPQLFCGGGPVQTILVGLAVPFWVLLTVQNLVGHVSGANDSAGRVTRRNLLARTGEPSTAPATIDVRNADCARLPGRIVRLRIVQDHEIRPKVSHHRTPSASSHGSDR